VIVGGIASSLAIPLINHYESDPSGSLFVLAL